MTGTRETNYLKLIDKAIIRMVSELPGRNESKRTGGLESEKPRRPSLLLGSEGSMNRRNLTDATIHFGGVLATAR